MGGSGLLVLERFPGPHNLDAILSLPSSLESRCMLSVISKGLCKLVSRSRLFAQTAGTR